MNILKVGKARRKRRKMQIRKRVFGTAERPRLSVSRSLKHIYAQVIDDTKGHTLLSMSTKNDPVREEVASKGGNKSAAGKVGAALAKVAIEKGITAVVFDRNGYKFHGRIKALADAARKAGLKF